MIKSSLYPSNPLRRLRAALVLATPTIRASHSTLTSSTRRRPRTAVVKHAPRPRDDRLQKLKTREGLNISKEQIQRLWNLFDSVRVQKDGEEIPQEWNLEEFVSKYPYIFKGGVSKAKHDGDGTLAASNSSIPNEYPKGDSKSMNVLNNHNNDMQLHQDMFHPVVQEAEIKLQRMLTKIHAHHDGEDSAQIPPDVQNKIRELITEELETVLDLWLKTSQTKECQTLQKAIATIDRASELLFYFQSLNEKGGIIIYPPIRCYQRVIDHYYDLFKVNESTLCLDDFFKFQSSGRKILRGMMKIVLTHRMHGMNQTDGSPLEPLSSWDRQIAPLHDSFNAVISMHSSPQVLNQPLTHTLTPKELQATVTDMNHASSKLLQEMELYYHDFQTLPLPQDDESLQRFLVSIHPTHASFSQVIGGLVRTAKHFGCIYSLHRAVDTLERMQKRYNAYEKSEETNMDEIVKPDIPLFEMVLRQCKEMNSELNLNRIENMIKAAGLETDRTLVEIRSTPKKDPNHQ